MTIGEILEALEAAKKAVPALETLGSGLSNVADSEKDDLKNAAVAVGKAVVDLKGGFVALEQAIKATLKS